MTGYKPHPRGTLLHIYVQPQARKTGFKGLHGEELKIALATPPVKGQANEALITYLSELLGVPEPQIELLTGFQSRHKKVLITGIYIKNFPFAKFVPNR